MPITVPATPETLIREDILRLSAYHVPSAVGMVKLDAMENPYRLPEMARVELARALVEAPINRYPDPTAPALKAMLRQVMRIPAGAGLMLGNGSDELIQLITHAVGRPGAVVLAPEPTFAMYRMNAQIAHIRFEGVALDRDFTLNADRFLAKIDELKPALIWIAYPNNPTGNCYPDADIEAIIRAAPGLVVLDEAYNIFAARSFLGRLAQFPNLIVMRTVSKVGLAGIRLGYAAAAPQWIDQLDKVRPPYNVSVLTQVVGEIALRYAAEFDLQAERIKVERARIIERLAALPGVQCFPTEANFVLVRVPDAPKLDAQLRRRKILIRNFHGGHPLLEHCLRLTVGTPEENEQLLKAFAEGLR